MFRIISLFTELKYMILKGVSLIFCQSTAPIICVLPSKMDVVHWKRHPDVT